MVQLRIPRRLIEAIRYKLSENIIVNCVNIIQDIYVGKFYILSWIIFVKS